MRFQAPLLVLAAAATTVLATPVGKNDPTFCERGLRLCNIAESWPDCSDLYIASMNACAMTGCIQWFMDPLAHCRKTTQAATS